MAARAEHRRSAQPLPSKAPAAVRLYTGQETREGDAGWAAAAWAQAALQVDLQRPRDALRGRRRRHRAGPGLALGRVAPPLRHLLLLLLLHTHGLLPGERHHLLPGRAARQAAGHPGRPAALRHAHRGQPRLPAGALHRRRLHSPRRGAWGCAPQVHHGPCLCAWSTGFFAFATSPLHLVNPAGLELCKRTSPEAHAGAGLSLILDFDCARAPSGNTAYWSG